ncbi:DegT/DnrJ/EryC1/StrS family aminotransferase [Amycolatopsis alkalitolerans]|uniref:DegT/DnrJ/EryC1/StrS aminotransferase family protein n=1 Tax=Amycolatopsis alkalitolerans TaxID=2547244 RepID=A0A5C4LT78_9PSEU|nr:DegT/DnrJ/EryC1/StrS aminotransferase family protein [Amycolatopsis alkalitolerans]TNC20989.1 DegT/DnrJ/EryC1/StrS aminotransferase family protein [Amycolatopsis alkalitolerans]
MTLALEGGRPVRTAPLPGWPAFGPAEMSAVSDVLGSGQVNYWTGPHGRAFEREFAARAGTLYAVAVANGTVALELALRGLGVGPGDEVVIPAATVMATASAVVRCAAKPVIADVDVHSQCLTRETVEPVLSGRTRAVVVVHLGGHPAELAPLLGLAGERGIRVVEDCAQAHGARYFGQPVGSFGDAAAWSFGHDQIITTGGEGGAVTTSDLSLWRSCWEYKDQGMNVAAVQGIRPHTPVPRLHTGFGTNARMTELQAAIGRIQLGRLDEWVKHRRANAALLLDVLRGVPAARAEDPPAHVEHAYHRFYAHLRPERLGSGWDRERVIDAINAEGIPCAPGGTTEIYTEPAFSAVEGTPSFLPVAAQLGRTSFTLPIHPALGAEEMRDVTDAVVKVLHAAMA